MKHRDDSGISGLDLVVALLVVSALISIMAPVFLSSSRRVQTAACATNRNVIMTRIAAYRKLKDVEPATLTQLFADNNAVVTHCPSGGVYVLNSVASGGNGELYCSVHYAGRDVAPPVP